MDFSKSKKAILGTVLLSSAALGMALSTPVGQSVFGTPTVYAAQVDNGLKSNSHLSVSSGWSNDLQSISWNSSRGGYDIYYLRSADGDRKSTRLNSSHP